MVKEFETVTLADTHEVGIKFDCYLSDSGDTLNLIHRNEGLGELGHMYLTTVQYANVDYQYNGIAYEPLYYSGLEYAPADAMIDISSIKSLLTIQSTTIKSATINIDLFAAEANVDTDYGSRRISLPYNVTKDSTDFNRTTDGIYIITVFYLKEWVPTVWKAGSLTYRNGIIYRNKTGTIGAVPGNSDEWIALNESDIYKVAQSPDLTESDTQAISQTLGINTRQIKQEIIIPLALSTSYARFDDIKALNKYEYYTNMREQIVSLARQNDILKSERLRISLIDQFNAGTVAKSPTGHSTAYLTYTI